MVIFFSVRFLSMCKLEQHSIAFDGLAHMVGDNENRTVWKGVISGPYFPVFSPNTGKYEPEITPY